MRENIQTVFLIRDTSWESENEEVERVKNIEGGMFTFLKFNLTIFFVFSFL